MIKETLIIDDDMIICILHEKLCRIHHLPNPKTFIKAEEALKYIMSHNDGNHNFTILLDINMPEMDGWQFLDALGKELLKAEIYVVVLSSSVDSRDQEKAATIDMVDAFVSKPLDSLKINLLKKDSRLQERLGNIA